MVGDLLNKQQKRAKKQEKLNDGEGLKSENRTEPTWSSILASSRSREDESNEREGMGLMQCQTSNHGGSGREINQEKDTGERH